MIDGDLILSLLVLILLAVVAEVKAGLHHEL